MKREAPPQSLIEAKMVACRRWPWAAEAIMFEMSTVKRPGLGTMAVDMYWRMYYDPAFLEDKSTNEIATVIMHELCHLVFRHHKRGYFLLGDDVEPCDNRDWQWATDVAVNEILLRERFPFPGEAITRRYLQLSYDIDVGYLPSAEGAYRKLQERGRESIIDDQIETFANLLREKPDGGQETDDSGETSGAGRGDESPEPEAGGAGGEPGTSTARAEPPEQQDGGLDGHAGQADAEFELGDDGSNGGDGQAAGPNDGSKDSPGPGSPSGVSGSCADGISKPWELGPPSDTHDGIGEERGEIVLSTIARNIVGGKDRGLAPGAFKDWATKILDPSVDPKQHILRVITKHVDLARGRGKRSYRRPSRRYIDSQFIGPSNYSAEPRITVCVDSSGSMGEDDTALALGLINKVLSSFRNRRGVKILVGDTEGQSTELVHSRLNRLLLTGGGGTDMGKLIEDAVASKPVPHVILVATDGYTPWPDENPGVPVLVCLTREGREDRVPDWMTVLKIY